MRVVKPPTTARYFDIEMFRGKPLSKHLAYLHRQVEGILASDLVFDEQMLVELQTLEIALPAYVSRAKKLERVQPQGPLVSWKRLIGARA